MMALAGCLLLVGLLVMVVVCLRTAAPGWPTSPVGWFFLFSLMLAIGVLWLRPEESMEAGEDPAAYLWSAFSFQQQDTFHFEDAGLAALPEHDRALFRYGHAGFLNTKDAVLWADDELFTAVRPHFFPLYSVLLAAPLSIGWCYGIFVITPLLALGCGLFLVALAYWLTNRRMLSWLALALYAFNPVIAWNARTLRAEWPATFLVLAGLLLWLSHVWQRKSLSAASAFWAGLSLAAATLFHVTTFYVVFPTIVVGVWQSQRTRFWVCWWCGLLCGLGLFFAQLIWVTDPYWILSNLLTGSRGRVAVVGLVSGFLVLCGVRYAWSNWTHRRELPTHVIGGLGGVVFSAVAVCLMLAYHGQGRIPGLPGWTASYISLTDFSAVAVLLSRSMLFWALCGVPLMCGRRGASGSLGRWLLLLLGPASMAIGWTNNFMFESRRMVMALLPLLVLSSIHLAGLLGRSVNILIRRLGHHEPRFLSRVDVTAVLALTGLLIIAGLRGRTHLYATWNYRGAYSFYRGVANEVADSEFILAEYTQSAVPVERLASLPTLPLAWGYRSEEEYRRAEQVWEDLVLDYQDKIFVLLTPFSGGILPGLNLEPLETLVLNTKRLGRARGHVPDGPQAFNRLLHLHRIRPPGQGMCEAPYTRIMDGGQLGLAGFANRLPQRVIDIEAVALVPGRPVSLKSLLPEVSSPAQVWLMVHADAPTQTPLLRLSAPGHAPVAIRVHSVVNEWQLVEFDIAAGIEPDAIQIEAKRPLALAAAFAVEPGEEKIKRLATLGSDTEVISVGADLQWLRSRSSVVLPGRSHTRILYLLAWAGHAANQRPSLTVKGRGKSEPYAEVDILSGWQWYGMKLPPTGDTGAQWCDFIVSPSWNSGVTGYPHDLGLLVHAIHLQ